MVESAEGNVVQGNAPPDGNNGGEGRCLEVDSRDHPVPDNVIPLSPQWLFSKPGEPRTPTQIQEGSLRPGGLGLGPSDRWREGQRELLRDGERKRDWWRLEREREPRGDREREGDGPPRLAPHRWREEERDVVGRREKWEGPDRRDPRWQDNSAREGGAGGGELRRERWGPEMGARDRDTVREFEGKRDGKWGRPDRDRWGGGDEKEKDFKRDKWQEADREVESTRDSFVRDKMKEDGGDSTRAGRDFERSWSSRHGSSSRVSDSSSMAGRGDSVAPGHGSVRPFMAGRGRGLGPTTGQLHRTVSGNAGNYVQDKWDTASTRLSSAAADAFRYPRGKLLDIYKVVGTASALKLPDGFVEVEKHTQVEMLEPLALVPLDGEEEALIQVIRKGEYVPEPVRVKGAPMPGAGLGRGRDDSSHATEQQFRVRGRGQGELAKEDLGFDGHREDDFFDAPGFGDIQVGDISALEKLVDQRFADSSVSDQPDPLEAEREGVRDRRKGDDMREDVNWRRRSSFDDRSDGLWRPRQKGGEDGLSRDDRSRRVDPEREKDERAWKAYEKPVRPGGTRDESRGWKAYEKALDDDVQQATRDEKVWRREETGGPRYAPEDRTWRKEPSFTNRADVASDPDYPGQRQAGEAKSVPPEDLELFYRDPQGETQGPFTGRDIIAWFKGGFFGLDLPVRQADLSSEAPFIPLSSAMPHLKPKPLTLPPGFDAARSQEEDSEQVSSTAHEVAGLSADFARQASIEHVELEHTVFGGQHNDKSVALFANDAEKMVTGRDISFAKGVGSKHTTPVVAGRDKDDDGVEDRLKEDVPLPKVQAEARPRRRMSAFSALAQAEDSMPHPSEGVGNPWVKHHAEEKGATLAPELVGSEQKGSLMIDGSTTLQLPSTEESLSIDQLLPHVGERQSPPPHKTEHPPNFGTSPQFDIAGGGWSGLPFPEVQGHNRIVILPQEGQTARSNVRSFDQVQSQPILQEQRMQHLQQENHQYPHPPPHQAVQGQIMNMSFPEIVQGGMPGGLPAGNHTGFDHLLNQLQPGVPPQLGHHLAHFAPHMIRHLPPHGPPAAHMDYALQHQQHQLVKDRSRESMMSPGELYALRQQQEQMLQHMQQGHKEHLAPGNHHAPSAWKAPEAMHHAQPPLQNSEQYHGVRMHSEHNVVPSFDHQRERFHAMQLEGGSVQGATYGLHLQDRNQRHFDRGDAKFPFEPSLHPSAPAWPLGMTAASHSAALNYSGPAVSLDRAMPAASQPGADDLRVGGHPLPMSQQDEQMPKVNVSLQDWLPESRVLPIPQSAAATEGGNERRLPDLHDTVGSAWSQRTSTLQATPFWRQDVEGTPPNDEPRHVASSAMAAQISAAQMSTSETAKKSQPNAHAVLAQEKALSWSSAPSYQEEDAVSGNGGLAWGAAHVPKPKSITEIQQEEAAQQQSLKDRAAAEPSLKTGHQTVTGNVSQAMSSWGVASAFMPAKSLRQIQEEEALIASSHTASAPGIAAALGTPASGAPWAVSTAPLQDQKPLLVDGMQAVPPAELASHLHSLQEEKAPAVPATDPPTVDQSDFVEPKESKKAKKAKKGKAATTGKGLSPSPSPVTPEQPPVSLGTQRRQSQQQEELDLPAAPGPSLGDFLKLRPGDEEPPVAQPAAWQVESIKGRKSLREIQEAEKKSAEARARQMSQLAQQQAQMMVAALPPGTRSGAGSSPWVRPAATPAAPLLPATSMTMAAQQKPAPAQQKPPPLVDTGASSARLTQSRMNEEEDELFWDYGETVINLGAVQNPQRTPVPDRQPEYPSLPADKAAAVRGNGKGNGASLVKPAAPLFRHAAAPVATIARTDFPSLSAAAPSPPSKAGKAKKAVQSQQPPAAQGRKNNQDAAAREQARAFRQWCESHIKHITGNDDMTLLEFCVSLPSSTEAGDYISQYLGSSPAVNNFKVEFLEKKHQLPMNVLRIAFPPSEAAIQDDPGLQSTVGERNIGKGDRRNSGSVVEQSTEVDSADGQGSMNSNAGLKKRTKKGKKVVDPRLLGFSVTSNRIMMGEIQHPDDI